MKLSCIPVSFFRAFCSGEMSIAEWLNFAAELGLDGIECGPLLVQPAGPVSPAEFRRMAEARGLTVSNFTAYSDFSHPDEEARRQEVSVLIEWARVACELGCPSIRALTGQQRDGVDQVQGIAWVVECIRRVGEAADRMGLRVNVENHTKAFTWTSFDFAIHGEVFLRVMEGLRDAPVGVQFDIANPLVAGEDSLALFERVRSRIGYVHVNDVLRPGVFEFVPIGTGMAPIRAVLAGLAQQGYDGWIGIEEASRSGKEGFRQAVKYTRDVLRELKRSEA